MAHLVPYSSPFGTLNQLQNEMNQLLGRFLGSTDDEQDRVITSHWVPPVDIKEEPDRFVILADIPGVESKDVEVAMEGGILTIKGERRVEESAVEASYSRSERVHGTFYRRFSMPDTADPERISAHCKNGVLEIVLPKQEAKMARRIQVNA